MTHGYFTLWTSNSENIMFSKNLHKWIDEDVNYQSNLKYGIKIIRNIVNSYSVSEYS